MNPRVVLVVARAENGAIGRDGRLPWHLPDDLRHFKRVTMGTPMVMGRRTFDSLPGLLPGRRHVVVTRDPDWSAPGAERAGTPQEALDIAGGERVSIIGGAEIFAAFLPLADEVILTEVHASPEADTFMPGFDAATWREVDRADHAAAAGAPAFSIVRLVRR
jgi:dihydrofolate reductase